MSQPNPNAYLNPFPEEVILKSDTNRADGAEDDLDRPEDGEPSHQTPSSQTIQAFPPSLPDHSALLTNPSFHHHHTATGPTMGSFHDADGHPASVHVSCHPGMHHPTATPSPAQHLPSRHLPQFDSQATMSGATGPVVYQAQYMYATHPGDVTAGSSTPSHYPQRFSPPPFQSLDLGTQLDPRWYNNHQMDLSLGNWHRTHPGQLAGSSSQATFSGQHPMALPSELPDPKVRLASELIQVFRLLQDDQRSKSKDSRLNPGNNGWIPPPLNQGRQICIEAFEMALEEIQENRSIPRTQTLSIIINLDPRYLKRRGSHQIFATKTPYPDSADVSPVLLVKSYWETRRASALVYMNDEDRKMKVYLKKDEHGNTVVSDWKDKPIDPKDHDSIRTAFRRYLHKHIQPVFSGQSGNTAGGSSAEGGQDNPISLE